MKRILMILSIALFPLACDVPEESEETVPAGAQGDATYETDDTTGSGSETTVQPTDTDVEAMGEIVPRNDWLTANPRPSLAKTCNVTCTVVALGSDPCPTTISGTGATTFLGGCTKACNKARGDAATKLPVGCQINTCNKTSC